MRVRDLVVRWGGEEFVILLPNTDLVTAEKIAERLKAEVQNNTGTTISLGVSYSDSHPDFDAVMHAADQAMYRVQASVRNRVCVDNSQQDTLIQGST